MNKCIIHCISHYSTVNSTHPISMADCTYLALTWVLKHFLCSRKRAWISNNLLKAVMYRQRFEAKKTQATFASSRLLFANKFSSVHLFFKSKQSSLSCFRTSPPLHDNIARGRCLKKLPVNPFRPSGVFILSFESGIAAACL